MDNLNEFIKNWEIDELKTKPAFIELKEYLEAKEGIVFDFKERKGVSYSLRPKHKNQKTRNIFAMIDVIDDDEKERWLSICFYGDMINDPDEKGDLIPNGLLGEDGYCFDYSNEDKNLLDYLKQRLNEAYDKAKNG